VVRTETSTVALPFVIQNAADLIQTVAGRLRTRGMEKILAGERFARFVRAARTNDIINDKIFDELPALAAIVMISIAGSAFSAIYMWHAFFTLTVLWIIIGFAIPLIAYLAANVMIAFEVAASLDSSTDSDTKIDAVGIYSRAGLAAGIVYLCLGILFKWCFIRS
jgi:hypothetical protein